MEIFIAPYLIVVYTDSVKLGEISVYIWVVRDSWKLFFYPKVFFSGI